MLAVAIFIMAGIAITTAMSSAADGVGRSRAASRAADLARSAMARIEAGIDSPRTLNGPVTSWLASEGGDEDYENRPEALGWELQISNDPSQFSGLTRVTVIAMKRVPGGGEAVEASFTLRQLVRLSGKGGDSIGDEDELGAAAARGARERSPDRPASRPEGSGGRP